MPESSGRKLDFLTQEMVREANTIGSKANDVEIFASGDRNQVGGGADPRDDPERRVSHVGTDATADWWSLSGPSGAGQEHRC